MTRKYINLTIGIIMLIFSVVQVIDGNSIFYFIGCISLIAVGINVFLWKKKV
ncbi:hypothetical protein PAECIP111893_03262 [Paenibacillus plantiphilus]|uniref:Uncharacterized protein n=1 Tax=Paenibacillus plantiphilus TaxID=2905650 RepID=A0ABM9CF79_9BACL|nr:hypothetical protein PAECIP111893_03262 [Paenibacillus plantiphilus]